MTPSEQNALYVYNGGLLTGRRIRRILELSGWDVRLGLPGENDWVGVWGQSPTAPRGEAIARKRDVPILRVEDAFWRSVLTGREGEPPLGLCLDKTGVHFDPSAPSDIETLLATHPLDDTGLLDGARSAIERASYWQISKYNNFDRNLDLPHAPYVLVIDQTLKDASVAANGADRSTFVDMLVQAQLEHPGAQILIKSHPETNAGKRAGHFTKADESDRIRLITEPHSPWALMQGAIAVYTLSSQLGFEAIFAGHRPRVFGQPFYAGWGLSDDEAPHPRRGRNLTRAQLFAAAMILYPRWYDPHADTLCGPDQIINILAARARAQDRTGYVAANIRLWKRPHMQNFFGRTTPVLFRRETKPAAQIAERQDRKLMIWGAAGDISAPYIRVEDGILRSRGLGAALTAPLSLVTDDLGIYYDPTQESRLEKLISDAAGNLPPSERSRTTKLINRLIDNRLTKYNADENPLPDLPIGHRVLVVGQVEDDASIMFGSQDISTNEELLRATRAAHPDACLIYKVHPDVANGFRKGAIAPEVADTYADVVLDKGDPALIIDAVDEACTITSTLGFEALLRGKPVTCLGQPFYAGWGLTHDKGGAPARRVARPDITALAHAVLIGYPRYFDPGAGEICPVEVALDRLTETNFTHAFRNRTIAKIAGLLPARMLAKRRRR